MAAEQTDFFLHPDQTLSPKDAACLISRLDSKLELSIHI